VSLLQAWTPGERQRLHRSLFFFLAALCRCIVPLHRAVALCRCIVPLHRAVALCCVSRLTVREASQKVSVRAAPQIEWINHGPTQPSAPFRPTTLGHPAARNASVTHGIKSPSRLGPSATTGRARSTCPRRPPKGVRQALEYVRQIRAPRAVDRPEAPPTSQGDVHDAVQSSITQ
jgi:hypothetical protein